LLENLALRQQILVLERQFKRPRFKDHERAFLALPADVNHTLQSKQLTILFSGKAINEALFDSIANHRDEVSISSPITHEQAQVGLGTAVKASVKLTLLR